MLWEIRRANPPTTRVSRWLRTENQDGVLEYGAADAAELLTRPIASPGSCMYVAAQPVPTVVPSYHEAGYQYQGGPD